MPRGVKKENLPSKVCVVCGRPFTWRKKWERVWDEVTTCSKSCNHKRRVANREQKGKKKADGGGGAEASATTGRLSPSSMDSQEVPRELVSTIASLGSIDSAEDHTIVDVTGEHEQRMAQMEILRAIEDELNNTDEALASPLMEQDVMDTIDDPVAFAKKQRKALKKAKKAERRAQRQGRGDPSAGQKTCDMCGKSVNLLIRCMYEPGQADWKMVCGKCWKIASGGVVDGDEKHPHYRYGGLWKNRRAQS